MQSMQHEQQRGGCTYDAPQVEDGTGQHVGAPQQTACFVLQGVDVSHESSQAWRGCCRSARHVEKPWHGEDGDDADDADDHCEHPQDAVWHVRESGCGCRDDEQRKCQLLNGHGCCRGAELDTGRLAGEECACQVSQREDRRQRLSCQVDS